MNRIRELREKKGISQKVLSIELSVKQPSVCSWEKGIKEPSNKNAKKLADYFGVSMDYLLCRNNDSEIEQPTDVGGELRALAIERVSTLSDPALVRVLDFLSGLEAGQEIGAAQAAAQESGSESS